MTSWPKDLFLSKKGRALIIIQIWVQLIQHELFHRALVGFNNIWIHFIFREFNCVPMPKIPSPIIQMVSRCLGGRVFFHFQRKLCIIFWWIIFWIRRFGLQLSFYLIKKVSLCFRYGFFAIHSLILSHLELSGIELLKLTPSILKAWKVSMS